MKNRRSRKLGREEWFSPAQAIVDRPHPEAETKSVKPKRKLVKRVQDRAHDEWLKWAQVVVDRLAAVAPEYIPLPMPERLTHDVVEKPGRGDWMKWAEVVVGRLTNCVRIYGKPPFEDVFMAEKERLEKNGRTLDLLRRIHVLTDDADTPTDSLTELEHHDERVISGLRLLMEETLTRLPDLSTDMQLLLKSGWLDNCNGRIADELFRGPMGYEPEGIGSGHPEHGRLPEALQDLLEREQIGQGRHPRDELRGPHPHTRMQGDLHARWGRRNAQSLRSAGRVE